MNKENMINSTVEQIGNILDENATGQMGLDQINELIVTLPEIIIQAEENGDIETCDINNLQIALRHCWRNSKAGGRREDMRDTIMNNIKEGKHTGTWIRGLVAVRTSPDQKEEILKELPQRTINTDVFGALEVEADRLPCEELMRWYEAILDRVDGSRTGDRVFQRLAFYYMHSTPYTEEIDKARAYLMAMERRGIIPDNPYGHFYGTFDHMDLIRSILNGTYAKEKIRIRAEYGRTLLRKIGTNGQTNEYDQDMEDLKGIWETLLNTLKNNRTTGEASTQEELDTVDTFLRDFGEVADCFLTHQSHSIDFARGAETMIEMLHDGESWLLRIIELEAQGDDDLRESERNRWITLIRKLDSPRCDLTLDALYNSKIRELQSKGNEQKVTEVLEEKVSISDAQAEFMQKEVETIPDLHRHVWCTRNAMVLIRRIADDSNNKVSDLIRKIHKTEENLDGYTFDGDNLHRVKRVEEYVELLETMGQTEEADWWRNRLATNYRESADRLKLFASRELASDQKDRKQPHGWIAAGDAGYFAVCDDELNREEALKSGRSPYTSPGSGAYIRFLYNGANEFFDWMLVNREEYGQEDMELFWLSGYATNITIKGYKKEYYLGIGDELDSIISKRYGDEKSFLLDHLCEMVSAYIGGDVRVAAGNTDHSNQELMYTVRSYATEFAPDGSSLRVYGTLEQTPLIEDLNERCEDISVPWSMALELPEERLSAVIEAMGNALELVGHDDDSLITVLSKHKGG